jgi:hypothetical protein
LFKTFEIDDKDKYLLEDSDFIERGNFGYSKVDQFDYAYANMFDIVADVYEKRKLNVAFNLALVIKITSDHNTDHIKDIKLSVKYKQYEKDIEKYLLLL